MLTCLPYILQVYSPYQRIWIAKLNEKISTYLEESPLPEANPSSVRQDPTFGALFNASVPHFVEGFELDAADRETMVKIWPAGSAAAQEVGSNLCLPTKSDSHL
jgi:deoxyribodipyrimidine photo-lyase